MVSEFLIRSQISSMIATLMVSLALLNAALERECNLFLSEIVLSLSTNSTLYCVTSLGKNLDKRVLSSLKPPGVTFLLRRMIEVELVSN